MFHSRSVVCLLGLVVSAGACSFVSAQVRSDPILKRLDVAREKADYAAAVRAYEDARRTAREKQQTSVEAKAALYLGDVYQEWAYADKDPARRSDRLRQAEQSYKAAASLNDPRLQRLAENNLGVLYTRMGKEKAGDAKQIFSKMNLDDLTPSQLAVYLCNHAAALEKDDQSKEAYRLYKQALDEEPRYQLAVEGAFRTLLRRPTQQDINEADRLAAELSKKGQSSAAAHQIRETLTKQELPHAQEILAILVRYYADVALTPGDFERRESSELSDIAKTQPALSRPIAEIREAYFGNFRPAFEDSEVRALFPSWTRETWQRRTFAALVRTTGDYYYRTSSDDRNPSRALARYAAAWRLNPDNTEPALQVAAVLRDYSRTVDPDNDLYIRFIDSLMEIKGDRYKVPVKTAADWDNILRLHFLLGSLRSRSVQLRRISWCMW